MQSLFATITILGRRAAFGRRVVPGSLRNMASAVATQAPMSVEQEADLTHHSEDAITLPPIIQKPKLFGREFYESIGSPKHIVAPMVDQSEFVSTSLRNPSHDHRFGASYHGLSRPSKPQSRLCLRIHQ
jgi:hypothetical protein